MRAVYALYPDGEAAQQAVDALRAAGLPDSDITVVSAQPMEDYEFGTIGTKTWMWWIACGGGLVGMAAGLGLTWLTSVSWPLNVGGMPVMAWWPNLIIIFELTMLGAILTTVITLVVSAGLFRRGPMLYDPEVTEGHILVGVENPGEESIGGLERTLGAPRGARVRTIDTAAASRPDVR